MSLFYLAGVLTVFWGAGHLFPTRNIVRDFGEISQDNRRIITMEWIVEGVALIFIGCLVILVTVIDPLSPVSRAVYQLSAACLIVLAVVSLFTGFKVDFPAFKLCPVIFGLSAALLLIGTLIS